MTDKEALAAILIQPKWDEVKVGWAIESTKMAELRTLNYVECYEENHFFEYRVTQRGLDFLAS